VTNSSVGLYELCSSFAMDLITMDEMDPLQATTANSMVEKEVVDVTGIEPATPCLQSINERSAAECDGRLRCSVFLSFSGLEHGPGFLPSAMVSYLAVHQIVHQVFRKTPRPFLACRSLTTLMFAEEIETLPRLPFLAHTGDSGPQSKAAR